MRRRTPWIVVAALSLPALGALWLWWPELHAAPVRDTVVEATADRIARGRYLARAGNCIGCHTQPGAPEYAGGRAIATPFGEVFSTNLTPDPETGLGRWSPADFYRALHHGISRDGRLLTPAFPYPNYTRVTRKDADALYAYLRSLPPVRRATPAAQLRFPYDRPLALRLWRRLYFQAGRFMPDPARSDAWNRGAYLVEGLGHCSACHGRRDALGGMAPEDAYAGGVMAALGWEAPTLTPSPPLSDADAREWVTLLKGGTARHAVASGPMAEVVRDSLQYLSSEDLEAMVLYLRSLPSHTAPAPRTGQSLSAKHRRALHGQGEKLYADHCADCHGKQGEGRPWVYPPLAGNPTVTAPSARNALRTLLDGGYAPSTAAHPLPHGMPPYAQQLGATEIAAVLTYVRGSWGNDADPVSPAEVRRH